MKLDPRLQDGLYAPTKRNNAQQLACAFLREPSRPN